jgi:hypothetical protein
MRIPSRALTFSIYLKAKSRIACGAAACGGMVLNTATWIAIYMPIFLLLFIFMPQQAQRRRMVAKKIRKKRGGTIMANELIKKYMGKTCIVTTGSFGSSVNGLISAVEDNWIEVETKKGAQLINTDFVTNITELQNKK